METLLDYAQKELKLCGAFGDDSVYGDMLGNAVMELVEVFNRQGHSGISAAITLRLFGRVANFKPLTPITDEPDQWRDIGAAFGTPGVMQHKRCGTVFKQPNDAPYNAEAIVFRSATGATYTCEKSAQPVTFPYVVPDHPEIVDEVS